MFDFFKNIKPDKKDRKLETKSADAPGDTLGMRPNPGPQSKTAYKVASCQSSGRERIHNEDTLFTLNCLIDDLDLPVSFGIFLVADGMGGHQSGEVASRLAAQATSQYLMEKLYNPFIFDLEEFSDEDVASILDESVTLAQKLINQQVPGGGTTLTSVVLLNERLFFVHIGDSRLYKIGFDGRYELLTKDHSLVKRLIDLGEITEAEANNHPQRNVLYRALGQADPFKPDIGQFSLKQGEKFLLCSDGLWGVVDDDMMIEMVNNPENQIETIACYLVEAANQAGGPDNISLVLVERLA